MGRKNHIVLFITLIVTGVTILFSVTDVSAVKVEDVLPKATSGYAGYFDNSRGVGRKESIEWTYDTTTKTLTFSGSGDMATNVSAEYIDEESDLKSGRFEKLGTWYIWHKEAEHIVIGEGITDIGVNAFYAFWGIEDISIPNSVSCIHGGAFKYASLKSITIPRSVEIIYADAFEGVNLKSITIPGSVKTIGVGAFAESDLEEITIEYGIEEIGEFAFSDCVLLEKIKFQESKKATSSSAMRIIPAGFCFECGSLKEINIPKSVKTIEHNAFDDCENLEKITLPNSLKRIENYAFVNAGLKSIKLPKSLEKIGKAVFSGTSLKTIEIPENVKVLGSDGDDGDIFSYNDKLRTVKIKSRKLKKVYGSAFKIFPSKAVIIVPKGKKKSYSKMFYKAGLSKKIKIKESKTW